MESKIELKQIYSNQPLPTQAFQFFPIHLPQCSCDFNSSKFIKKTLTILKFSKLQSSCKNAVTWLQKSNPPQDSVLLYHNLLQIPLNNQLWRDQVRQINLDIDRTFPENSYFSSERGRVILGRLLLAVVKYNQSIGYVQGMNYLAASLLYHASQVDAFWILIGLMQKYNLKENYLPGLPGLNKHSRSIQIVLMNYTPQLLLHLEKMGVSVEMVITQWCLTLFLSNFPVQCSTLIFECFFQIGWLFFYKLVVLIFIRLENKVFNRQNVCEILSAFRVGYNQKFSSFLKLLKVPGERISWKRLVKSASELDIHLIL